MADLIERQEVMDTVAESALDLNDPDENWIMQDRIKEIPSAQPELIAQGAYVRGFEQGRTQGMLDVKLQPTCNKLATDCVSRQAAIDAADSIINRDTSGNNDVVKAMTAWKEHIKGLPSAQPEPQWIPCSERLPEDLEEVNVTWVNHKPEPYYDFVKGKPFTASAVYYKGKWFWYTSTCADLLAEYGKNPNHEIDDAIEITAWMPLPEPWRGEEHGTS